MIFSVTSQNIENENGVKIINVLKKTNSNPNHARTVAHYFPQHAWFGKLQFNLIVVDYS